ncbi:MAG TPA: 50S ribosomal protein L25/general stress protein Ctc [Thiobacillaceae bacterium]|nr:50S ribosomal protein L25/general stress protein Ctc [Thiobacillaceae bacterium]HNI09382.1 50S ribosomal protein L25/general stress protein Ctc [Thiobacillaceae bacterium]
MHIAINASKREAQGTGASRRLRRAGRVPGIVYGGGKDAQAVDLDHKELFFALKNEAFHSSVLDMVLDGSKEAVLLRDFQMHPYKPLVLHVDFQRVDATHKVHLKVPLHFVNADVAPGVKLGGGVVNHILTEVDVICLPDALPEFIVVDLGKMEAGQSLHLSDLTLPAGVELSALARGDDHGVVNIIVRGGGEAEAAGEAVA